jgi:hypothetical protein
MQITLEQFVEQFAISIGVHALKVWRRRSKSPPDLVGLYVYKTIFIANGEVPITSTEFCRIVEPVILELHQITPWGQRPGAIDLSARIYDALSVAGVEVTIRPPVRSHGGMQH